MGTHIKDALVDQNAGHALSGKLCGSIGEHVHPTTETVGDEHDVGAA